MRRMIPRALVLVLAAILAAGCATTNPPRPPVPESPRVRCLADPTETSTRPLFFLFCMQSP